MLNIIYRIYFLNKIPVYNTEEQQKKLSRYEEYRKTDTVS